jgi:hypothetical protein
MNGDPLIHFLNSVLQLQIGEGRVIREPHLHPCTVHRYRDGWSILLDHAGDRHCLDSRAFLGWHFNHVEDLVDFLTGEMDAAISLNFALEGELL